MTANVHVGRGLTVFGMAGADDLGCLGRKETRESISRTVETTMYILTVSSHVQSTICMGAEFGGMSTSEAVNQHAMLCSELQTSKQSQASLHRRKLLPWSSGRSTGLQHDIMTAATGK